MIVLLFNTEKGKKKTAKMIRVGATEELSPLREWRAERSFDIPFLDFSHMKKLCLLLYTLTACNKKWKEIAWR